MSAKMTRKLVLYKTDISPPVKAVLMTLNILGIEPELVEVSTVTGDTRKPEYVAKNPMHTVPLLKDGDFILADSHAIITYLVSKYGADKKEDLYPMDYNLRATIDQRLHFDNGILFPRFMGTIKDIFYRGATGPTPEQVADAEEAFGMLERYLEKKLFVATDRLTLADISIVSTVSNLDDLVPVTDKFPKLLEWFGRMKETDFYQKANVPGLEKLKTLTKMKMEANAA